MSNYIVEEDGELYIYENGEETDKYYELYSDSQKIKHKILMHQLMKVWFKVESELKFFINYNIDITELMGRIYKLFFLKYRSLRREANKSKSSVSYSSDSDDESSYPSTDSEEYILFKEKKLTKKERLYNLRNNIY